MAVLLSLLMVLTCNHQRLVRSIAGCESKGATPAPAIQHLACFNSNKYPSKVIRLNDIKYKPTNTYSMASMGYGVKKQTYISLDSSPGGGRVMWWDDLCIYIVHQGTPYISVESLLFCLHHAPTQYTFCIKSWNNSYCV